MVADAGPPSDVRTRETGAVEAPPTELPGERRQAWGSWDLITMMVLFLAAIAIRRPGYMLQHPFWLDEAWVADSLRAPLRSLPHITSSSPLGFTLLLRLVPPIGGPERIRIVPLLFGAAVAPLGYVLGRTLDPDSRWRAIVLGVAGVLLPATLRHDLKQYTADAFCALLLVVLVARLEVRWSPRRLAALASVACVAPILSHTSILVSMPAMGLLVLVLLARRRHREAAWTAAAAALSAVAFGAMYLFVDSAARTPQLVRYWEAYYVPTGRGRAAALDFVVARWDVFVSGVGFGWRIVAMALLVLGCVVLARFHLHALAALLPVLLVESIVVATMRLYPLWDERTSTYLVSLATMVAVIGLTYGTELLPRRVDRRVATPIAVLASILVIGLTARTAADRWASPLVDEDTRGAAAYVAAHRQPGDVVLVDLPAGYGFAFYWPDAQPGFVSSSINAVGFVPRFDRAAGIEVRTGIGLTGLDSDVERAARLAAGHTLWIVVSHTSQRVVDAYLAAGDRVGTTRVVNDELIAVDVPPTPVGH